MANLLGFMIGIFLFCAVLSFISYLISTCETFFFVYVVAAVVMMFSIYLISDAISTHYIISNICNDLK